MSIEGKVALVTGASRGIGKAIAEALGKMGATVIGTATSESGAKAIDERLKADGYKGGGVVLNVTDGASVEQAIKTINEQFGSIDILVNNAGIQCVGPLAEIPLSAIENTFNTNVFGNFSPLVSML